MPSDHSLAGLAMTLRADRTRATALVQLAEAGIPVILLKGPTLQWAWSPAPRPYIDVDLLVHPSQHADAIGVLERAGFSVRVTLAVSGHAATVDRAGDASVDLHWTLAMSGVSADETWSVLERHAERSVDGCLWLDRGAAAAVAVLHAAQTPRGSTKPRQDVDALAGDLSVLRDALAVADELLARRAFALGLSITPAGVEASAALGVAPPSGDAVAEHAAVPLGLVLKLVRRRRWWTALRLLWPRRSDLPEGSARRLWRFRRLSRGLRASFLTVTRGLRARALRR